MKFQLIPILIGATTLAISTTPAPLRAEEFNPLSYPAANSTQQLNLTPEEQSIISAINLSSNQKAQLQRIERPLTLQHIQPILTPGQHHLWLQMRRAYSGGR
ncbi:MAG: hypothetical protein H0X31_09265 [Nostocaceae cyanobacterium]|nr:hypothetical protein [Nostocaceae cyanobacterium]